MMPNENQELYCRKWPLALGGVHDRGMPLHQGQRQNSDGAPIVLGTQEWTNPPGGTHGFGV